MKQAKFLSSAILASAFLASAGCASLAMKFTPVTVIGGLESKPSLALGAVTVDKPSGARSVEREIRRILPSMFAARGVSFGGPDASFAADVLVVEREYVSGTSSVRSFMLEIAVVDPKSGGEPAVIARKSVEGASTSASSADLYEMLSSTMDELVKRGFSGAAKGAKPTGKTSAAVRSDS